MKYDQEFRLNMIDTDDNTNNNKGYSKSNKNIYSNLSSSVNTDFSKAFNFLTNENNAKIIFASSETTSCPITNVISENRRSIWISKDPVPQYFIIDLAGLIRRPKERFKYFGVYCWHAYETNPKRIHVEISRDSNMFIPIGQFELHLKPGTQIFELRDYDSTGYTLYGDLPYRYMKIIIRETYGGERTYLNQVLLYEDLKSQINYGWSSNNNATTENSEGGMLNNNINNVEDAKGSNNNESKVITKKKIQIDDNKLKKIKDIVKNGVPKINFFRRDNKKAPEYSEGDLSVSISRGSISNEVENGSARLILPKKQDVNKSKQLRNIFLSNANNNHTESNVSGFKSNGNNSNSNDQYKKLNDQLDEMDAMIKSMEAESLINSHGFISSGTSFHRRCKSSNLNYNNPFEKNHWDYSTAYYDKPKYSDNPFSFSSQIFNSEQNENNINNKIQSIEDKLNNFGADISELKFSFHKLIDNIQNNYSSGINNNQGEMNIPINSLNSSRSGRGYNHIDNNSNNMHTQNELINLILCECEAMINQKLLEINRRGTSKPNTSSKPNSVSNSNAFITFNTKSSKENGENDLVMSSKENKRDKDSSFDKRLNKKIEEQFDNFSSKFESDLFNKLLKPSLSTIENTIKSNLSEIKSKINKLTNKEEEYEVFSNRSGYQSDVSSNANIRNPNKRGETERERLLDHKLEEINILGGKLYDKLVEKEKRLNEIKENRKGIYTPNSIRSYDSARDKLNLNFDYK